MVSITCQRNLAEYKHHTLGETLGGTGTRSSTLMERSIPDLSECHHPSGMFESLKSTLRRVAEGSDGVYDR